MRKQEWSRLASHVTAAAVLWLCAGCHSIRAQIAALRGQSADTTSASPTKGTPQPKIFQYGKGPTPILDRSYRPVHEPFSAPLRYPTPHFESTNHTASGSATFQDPEPSPPRHQRVARARLKS